MRLIHTADWHLCERLGRLDRGPDLRARIEHVAKLCLEHQADVLLIAGDLFSEQASVEQMTEALKHIRETFAAFFAGGGTILAVTGNHDRDGRINIVRAGMTLAAPGAGQDGGLSGGRMYLLNGRALTTMTDKAGLRVQFVLVPYPFAHRYDLSATEYRSREEEHRLLHGRIAEWIQQTSTQAKFNASLPTVLVAHLHVRGAEVHSLYKLTEGDDVLFDFADLNPGWAYVALGHIHKPQAVGGSVNVRYPGSLDRLDFGETHDGHGVLLIDIGPDGLIGEPIHLPIPATPFHSVTIKDPEAELPTLAELYPDRASAVVRVTVSPSSSAMSRDEVIRELRKLFPKLHDIRWEEPARPDVAVAVGFTPRSSVEATVRDYLDRKLEGDVDRESILALAEAFLKESVES